MNRAPQTEPPTYAQTLEAIGWYFDRHSYRHIFVAEVADGYIGKASAARDDEERQVEGLSFPRADVTALLAEVPRAGARAEGGPPLCPDGYGAFMHVIGEMCDRNQAELVSLVEMVDGFALGFTAQAPDGHHTLRRRLLIDRVGIEELMSRVES